jgi:steroid delta-isomerase
MQGMLTATERITVTPDQISIAGDSAAFKWTVQLTTKRGQSAKFDGIDVVQLNDGGEIQTLHAYWDPAPVLAVLHGYQPVRRRHI